MGAVPGFGAGDWEALQNLRVIKGSLTLRGLSRTDLFPFRNLERLLLLVRVLFTKMHASILDLSVRLLTPMVSYCHGCCAKHSRLNELGPLC